MKNWNKSYGKSMSHKHPVNTSNPVERGIGKLPKATPAPTTYGRGNNVRTGKYGSGN